MIQSMQNYLDSFLTTFWNLYHVTATCIKSSEACNVTSSAINTVSTTLAEHPENLAALGKIFDNPEALSYLSNNLAELQDVNQIIAVNNQCQKLAEAMPSYAKKFSFEIDGVNGRISELSATLATKANATDFADLVSIVQVNFLCQQFAEQMPAYECELQANITALQARVDATSALISTLATQEDLIAVIDQMTGVNQTNPLL